MLFKERIPNKLVVRNLNCSVEIVTSDDMDLYKLGDLALNLMSELQLLDNAVKEGS